MRRVVWVLLIALLVVSVSALLACDGDDCGGKKGGCKGDCEKNERCKGDCDKKGCDCDKDDDDDCDDDDDGEGKCEGCKGKHKKGKKCGGDGDDGGDDEEGCERKWDKKTRKRIIMAIRKLRWLIAKIRHLEKKKEDPRVIEALEEQVRAIIKWLKEHGINWRRLSKRKRLELDPDVKKLIEALERVLEEMEDCDDANKLRELRRRLERILKALRKYHIFLEDLPDELKPKREKSDGKRGGEDGEGKGDEGDEGEDRGDEGHKKERGGHRGGKHGGHRGGRRK